MKITPRQLRRIIQEEAQKCLVEEYTYAEAPTSQVLLDDLTRWREEILGMMDAIEQANVQPPGTSDPGPGPSPDIHEELVAKLERAAAELFSVTTMLKQGAKGQLIDEEYRGSRDDTRGGYGNWKGFTPMDAEKLAKELAAKSPNRHVSYGDMQDLIAAAKKFTSSREAKEGIISWLVNKGFGQRVNYR